MKTFIVLLVALVARTEAATDNEVLRAWNAFKKNFDKTYENSSEEEFRKITFMATMDRITEHNSKYEQGLVSFKMGINKYSDMPDDEFERTMYGLNPGLSENHEKSAGTEFVELSARKLPREVDWRKKGAVTEVKEQGDCESCWSFSAAGAVETQYFLKTGKLVSLSAQNLIDCMSAYGSSGCNRGYMTDAFLYMMDYGIEAESDYPYKGNKSEACHYDQSKSVTCATGFVNLPPGNEEQLKAVVANTGPVSVGFCSIRGLKDYHSGIYYNRKCSSKRRLLNHALLVVGYGTERGKDYWLAKNTLGTSWGENGYLRTARNRKNHCGIATLASYATVKDV